MAYNFTPTTRLYVNGGDMSGNYDPLSFWNRRVFGFGFGLKSSYFDLDVTAGQTSNSVEGVGTDSTVVIPGTYKETFLAVKPEFKFGRYVKWGLNLINGKEDPKSIKYGVNPTESLVLGTTLALNFDNNRIRVLSSVQASVANKDASQEVPFDSLKDKFDLPGSAESAADFLESTGFLTLSQGLAPFPNLAMQYDLYLSYFNNNFKFTYKRVDPNYVTAGNPYLLTGLKGIFINDNIRLVNNQVFLNLYFKSYTDNLSQNEAETDNTHIGASISYFPMQNLPSITLNFNNQARENNIAATDSVFYPEDNTTQNIGVSSSYNFATGDILNTATISVNTYNRDDKIVRVLGDGSEFSNNSEFTVFTLAVKNKFEFPMTTRLGFSQSNNLFGKNSSNESETNITRFYGGLEYEFERVFEDVNIRPFANFNLQQIESGNIDYTRTNYNAGLYLQSSQYGILSLRFDYIDYGDQSTFKDTIFTTRYDVTF